MNLRTILLVFFLLPYLYFLSYSQYITPPKEKDLTEVLESINNDSILMLERLAALHFHDILNEYRTSNELPTLEWNDIFWLVCQNHSIYMLSNNILDHYEKGGKGYSSGFDPGDRLDYVQSRRNLSLNFENALYDFFVQGSSQYITALNIAESSFNLWKSSPGHNSAMLNPHSGIHGVAYKIDSNIVFATSLFGNQIINETIDLNSCEDYNSLNKQEINMNSLLNVKAIENDNKSVTSTLIGLKKFIELNFCSEILDMGKDKIPEQDKVLRLSARKHVRYIAANNELSHRECKSKKSFYGKDPTKRIAKSEGKVFWFLKKNMDVVEYVSLNEFKGDVLDVSMIIENIRKKLVIENSIDTEKIENTGFSVKIIIVKNRVLIYTVLLLKFED